MTDEERQTTTVQLAVVGAGQAGVSWPSRPHDRGLRPLLFEKTELAAFWWAGVTTASRSTPAGHFSHLPNRPYPKGIAAAGYQRDLTALIWPPQGARWRR